MWQDGVGAFRSKLPRAENPRLPAGVGDEPGAPSVFARRIDVQGVATLARQRLGQARRELAVQGLEVGQKAGGEGADLAAGESEAVFPPQQVADFGTLAMLHETLQAHEDLDVVAVDRSGGDQGTERGGTPRDLGARGLSAAGGTDPDRFPGGEDPVGESGAGVSDRLLHHQRTAAAGTGLGRGLYGHHDLGTCGHRLLLSGPQLAHLVAKRGQGADLEFFLARS